MSDVPNPQAPAEDDATDVYPVGLFSDFKRGRVRYGLRHYLWRQAKARNWRAVRNYFNGYLAEHRHGGHNAGRGWTKRAAVRRVERLCPIPPADGGLTCCDSCGARTDEHPTQKCARVVWMRVTSPAETGGQP